MKIIDNTLKLIKYIYSHYLEVSGTSPVSLCKLINSNYLLSGDIASVKRNIKQGDVIKWQEWTSKGISTYAFERSRRFNFDVKELDNLTDCKIDKKYNLDIQDVEGLYASKSNLDEFSSLDEMVETNSKEMIDSITQEKLDENLAHKDIRIIHNPTHDSFRTYGWDKRIFLINSGGSHHFAATRYIASRIGVTVALQGELKTYSINKNKVKNLLNKFNIFLFAKDQDCKYYEFNHTMQIFKVDFLQKQLPYPYHNQIATFIPRGEPRADKVSSVLKGYNFFDLGKYLLNISS